MIDIKFVIGGREVSPDQVGAAFEDMLQTAVLEAARGSVEGRLGSVRCPVHGGAPQVTATGDSISHLRFEVGGCCSKLIEAATAALGKE